MRHVALAALFYLDTATASDVVDEILLLRAGDELLDKMRKAI